LVHWCCTFNSLIKFCQSHFCCTSVSTVQYCCIHLATGEHNFECWPVEFWLLADRLNAFVEWLPSPSRRQIVARPDAGFGTEPRRSRDHCSYEARKLAKNRLHVRWVSRAGASCTPSQQQGHSPRSSTLLIVKMFYRGNKMFFLLRFVFLFPFFKKKGNTC